MAELTILDLISDGHLYDADSTVYADSLGCRGCSHCCEKMCDTIILDPYDLYSLTRGLGKSYTDLLDEGLLEIGFHDCLDLPKIKDTGAGCGFLSDEKRCKIHDIRPGICRLFPLGRYYHDETFSYILQPSQCKVKDKGPVTVRDWLGIPEFEKYEEFADRWHYFLKKYSRFMMESEDYDAKDKIKAGLLHHFYEQDYDTEAGFYEQFYSRLETWKEQA